MGASWNTTQHPSNQDEPNSGEQPNNPGQPDSGEHQDKPDVCPASEGVGYSYTPMKPTPTMKPAPPMNPTAPMIDACCHASLKLALHAQWQLTLRCAMNGGFCQVQSQQ